MAVGDAVLYENGGIWGGEGGETSFYFFIFFIFLNLSKVFFAQILVKISQSSFQRFQTFSEQFEKKCNRVFFMQKLHMLV